MLKTETPSRFRFDQGAQIEYRLGGGDPGTTVICDKLGSSKDHTVAEVDERGAVTQDWDGRFRRFFNVTDYNSRGAQVLIGTNNNPFLKPGETVQFSEGGYVFTVTANAEKGVTLNGQPATVLNDDETRYPSNARLKPAIYH